MGTRLKHLRTERMLSQLELGALIGVHRTEVSKYETGTRRPKKGTQLRLEAIFDEPAWQLLLPANANGTDPKASAAIQVPDANQGSNSEY